MGLCLFCQSAGPFSTVEHIVPESLGNDEDVLHKQVCDKCQAYFGTKIEQYILAKTPFAVMRTFLGIKTKKGRFPSVDMSGPSVESGIFPSFHQSHDNVRFTGHEDGSIGVEVFDPTILNEIIEGKRQKFTFVITPEMLYRIGQFLCKIGIEVLCKSNSDEARLPKYEKARRYARFGDLPRLENSGELWPIYSFSRGLVPDVKRTEKRGDETVEVVTCYAFQVLEFASEYTLFLFSMGNVAYMVCLNEPFIARDIRTGFPDEEIQCFWYPKSSWASLALVDE